MKRKFPGPPVVPATEAHRCWHPRDRFQFAFPQFPKVLWPALFSSHCRWDSGSVGSPRAGSAPLSKPANPQSSSRESKFFRYSVEYSSQPLRNNHSIARLQADVLLRILALNHILIVERDFLLRSVRSLPKNVDRLLLRKVFKSARHRDRIKHGSRTRQQIGSGLAHHTENVHLLALALADDDRDFGLGYITLQALGDLLFQLQWRLTARLQL